MFKQYLIVILTGLLCPNPINAMDLKDIHNPQTLKNKQDFSKKEIEQQLLEISIAIDYNVNKNILQHIKAYTLLAKRKTEGTLGRSLMYFPIINQYINQYGLPDDLKALVIIESALCPTINSNKGASGFWQLMPRTARHYGLVIDDYVDERHDIHKSTNVAMQHLSMLYDQFGNWNLAIAAYNCGAARVQKAIHKSQSRNYNRVRKHLPKETQNYLEKYVAANYLLQYYLLYDIHPSYPDYNLVVTKTIHINTYTTFSDLQTETGLAMGVLQQLNPSYKKGIVPPNHKGNYLVIPKIGSKTPSTKVLAKQQDKTSQRQDNKL